MHTNKSEIIRAGLFCVTLSSGPAFSGSIGLSGKVVRADGSALPGVVVKLSLAGVATTTDGQGNWTFAPSSVGIEAQTGLQAKGERVLMREQGSLRIRFAGRDAAGRGPGTLVDAATPAHSGLLRSASGLPDTVTYSYGQKVFRRDTLSNLDTIGIVRVYDTTWNAAILYGELRDVRDGKTYRTVTLGSQGWMAENLAYSGPSDTTGSCYFNSPDSCAKYGRLYRWHEALQLVPGCDTILCLSADHPAVQGACPAGWHVPTPGEWSRLIDTLLGYDGAGAALKSVTGWKTDNGTDAYGFRALPGGYRSSTGSFYQAGRDAMWWAALESDPGTSWDRSLSYLNTIFNQGFVARPSRLSIRCVMN